MVVNVSRLFFFKYHTLTPYSIYFLLLARPILGGVWGLAIDLLLWVWGLEFHFGVWGFILRFGLVLGLGSHFGVWGFLLRCWHHSGVWGFTLGCTLHFGVWGLRFQFGDEIWLSEFIRGSTTNADPKPQDFWGLGLSFSVCFPLNPN